jgi:hypothetical protein
MMDLAVVFLKVVNGSVWMMRAAVTSRLRRWSSYLSPSTEAVSLEGYLYLPLREPILLCTTCDT